MKKHKSPISGVDAFGEWVATAGYDNQVILWNGRTNEVLASVSHEHLANQCQFSSCGNYLVSASSDYTAKIWSVPDLKLVCTLEGHKDDVEMASIHKNKNWVATASRDGIVRVYDFQGSMLAELLGHEADVISVLWGKKSSELITTSDDGTLRIWDFKSNTCQVVDLGNTETDTLVVFDESIIFTGNDEGKITTLRDGQIVVQTKYFEAGIKRLVGDISRRYLLALSYDRTFSLFKVDENNQLELVKKDFFPPIVWPRSACFFDNEILFASFGDCYARYDLDEEKWHISHIGPTHGINALAEYRGDVYSIGDAGIFRKNGEPISNLNTLCNFIEEANQLLLTGGQMGTVYNAVTGEVLAQLSSPINDATTWQYNDRVYVGFATYVGTIEIFEIINGRLQIGPVVKALGNAIKSICNDGQTVFCVGAGGDACELPIETLNSRQLGIVHDKIANGCDVSENCSFVSAGRDQKLRIFKNGKIEVIDTPHDHSIKSICTDPSGNYIATGSYYGQIGVYHRIRRQWLKFEKISSSGISCLTFDQNKDQFLAGSYNGNIYAVPMEF